MRQAIDQLLPVTRTLASNAIVVTTTSKRRRSVPSTLTDWQIHGLTKTETAEARADGFELRTSL